MATWHVYDHENKQETAPPVDDMVWVVEDFYHNGEVTVGLFDGFTFRVLPSGSDDCSVRCWTTMQPPVAPRDIP